MRNAYETDAADEIGPGTTAKCRKGTGRRGTGSGPGGSGATSARESNAIGSATAESAASSTSAATIADDADTTRSAPSARPAQHAGTSEEATTTATTTNDITFSAPSDDTVAVARSPFAHFIERLRDGGVNAGSGHANDHDEDQGGLIG